MKANVYRFLPVGLLGLALAGWVVMIRVAVADPTFSVEPDYYAKAARYDDVLKLRADSLELGWQVRLRRFEWGRGGALHVGLSLLDAQGRAVDGARLRVEALANLRGRDVQVLLLETDEQGEATGLFPRGVSGLWELRIEAERDGARFGEVLRTELRSKTLAGRPGGAS